MHRMRPPQGHDLVIAEWASQSTASMPSTASATKHQPGTAGTRGSTSQGGVGQQVSETGPDQHDQRDHQHGVEHQVTKVEQVTAGEQWPPLRRP
jgi:hypothetical protein